jgi:hypothetical protein
MAVIADEIGDRLSKTEPLLTWGLTGDFLHCAASTPTGMTRSSLGSRAVAPFPVPVLSRPYVYQSGCKSQHAHRAGQPDSPACIADCRNEAGPWDRHSSGRLARTSFRESVLQGRKPLQRCLRARPQGLRWIPPCAGIQGLAPHHPPRSRDRLPKG